MTTPKTVYLKDYTPPDYLIESVDLHIELGEEQSEVRSQLILRRNHDGNRPLILNGEELTLKSITLDGETVPTERYQIDTESLTINDLPDTFSLEITTEIKPQENSSLNGLYQSSGNFCTQCEAEGFRKITYFLDRPDVMALYTTTIVADKTGYPVLLSNGNMVASGDLDDGRHWAKWQDPFKKPCYLYALVAGQLEYIEDHFTTRSGREVLLRIYVEKHNIDKCDHAMRSLKNSMRWDEKNYGREYDLDIYMIVAVDDFNMGAMENKGLNIFNSKYVLAKPETATDSDYCGIEGVIGHEYFHNWSGNRVTCRDWFQLSLKEGFTVFRDQQFSGDMLSPAVKRIEDVNMLRSHQFLEDAGPMAHPIRPDSYVEINNFYTLTVYEKGAEVVRMLHTLLGATGFRNGCDLYFQRHDGQAVTTDDFVCALEDANGIDLKQFRHWYSQAGTPELQCQGSYDAAEQCYTLSVKQSAPTTPNQTEKRPYHLPLTIGLLDSEGQEMALQLRGESSAQSTSRVIELRQTEEQFHFINLAQPPTPSLLRGFSAPVKLQFNYSDQQLAFLMANDSDEFNRWEAGQRLALKVLLTLVKQQQKGTALQPDESGTAYINALKKILCDDTLESNFRANLLSLPTPAYISEFMTVIDPVAIHEARHTLRREIANRLEGQLWPLYESNQERGEYAINTTAMGRRHLKNSALYYLMSLQRESINERCYRQFSDANNMTDVTAALGNLSNSACPQREKALQEFYARWQDEPLVVDKWLMLQATSQLPKTLDVVKRLTSHQAFTIKNPNKVRSLIGAFCQGNPLHFHRESGEGYRFLTDYVQQLNRLNPQIAARLLSPLTRWRRYDEPRQKLMKAQLEEVLATPNLSKDLYEIAAKSLK